jgi:putative hydrolase of HD superfamily
MMMAHVLKEYAEQTIDINRVTALLLVHDIVEIDAGDTFAFASEHELNGQRDREVKALERIMGILPPEQHEEFKALWLEFDEGKTPNAMYAIAIDRLSPLLQNVVNDGGSWARHSISRTQLIDRNQYLRESAPKLWNYALQQIEIAVDKGWIKSSQD